MTGSNIPARACLVGSGLLIHDQQALAHGVVVVDQPDLLPEDGGDEALP